jgi:hypothetical protein
MRSPEPHVRIVLLGQHIRIDNVITEPRVHVVVAAERWGHHAIEQSVFVSIAGRSQEARVSPFRQRRFLTVCRPIMASLQLTGLNKVRSRPFLSLSDWLCPVSITDWIFRSNNVFSN